jgi:signal transduction histidine kinase
MIVQPQAGDSRIETATDQPRVESAALRFIAAASHDVRQPMHALSLYLTALERRIDGAEALDIVQRMRNALDSMTGAFATLQDYLRAHGEADPAEVCDVSLRKLLRDLAAAHEGIVTVDLSSMDRDRDGALEDEVIVRTDPWLFDCALRQLVSNAIKHGGGAAWITVRSHGADVAITVSDRGCGIAPTDHARVFDDFVRLEGGAREGLGLGLSIVRRIADILGTPLTLSSDVGQGAHFTLQAPRA